MPSQSKQQSNNKTFLRPLVEKISHQWVPFVPQKSRPAILGTKTLCLHDRQRRLNHIAQVCVCQPPSETMKKSVLREAKPHPRIPYNLLVGGGKKSLQMITT